LSEALGIAEEEAEAEAESPAEGTAGAAEVADEGAGAEPTLPLWLREEGESAITTPHDSREKRQRVQEERQRRERHEAGADRIKTAHSDCSFKGMK